MVYFLILMLLLAFIATIVFTVMLVIAKKGTDKFNKYRKRAFSSLGATVALFVAIIAFQAAFGSDDSSSTKTSSESSSSSSVAKAKPSKRNSSSSAKSSVVKKKEQSSSSKKESSNSSSKTNSSEKSSSSSPSKKVEQANAALVSRLDQSQGWADGKLDENGNPTENGTPNPTYNWSKLITSIKYAENELTIYVNKDYAGLPKTQFASYMTRAENASLNALQEAGIIDDADVQKGLYTRVFDGDTKLAQSKVTDLHQFKINQ